MEKYYTVSEVVKILKRSRPTVYAYIRSGLLKARQLSPEVGHNSKLLITESDLQEFVSAGVPKGYYQKLYPRPHKGEATK